LENLTNVEVCLMGTSPSFRFLRDRATRRGGFRGVVPVLAALLGVFLVSLPAFSQANQGTIQGAVFDQSGGVIPGAMVTVLDVARGTSRALTTDNAGQYIAVNVTPGTYTVRAEAKGFRVTEHSGVLVEVGKTIRVDLTLQAGEQTQTVTVTGELPAIDTTDATLGGTVSNEAINTLPLNGRNFLRLLNLRPGVYTNPGEGAGNASTNGGRTGTDLLMVDGVPAFGNTTGSMVINSVYRTGDSNSLVPIDAIQEFNTEQNPKAEYGWRPGSVIDVGIKSGTNSIHGTAYAFGRDALATDAGNFFSTPGTNPVTDATVEQFGATAGGPVLKDKLFWFLGYEGLRTSLVNPIVLTIPSSVTGLGVGKSMVDTCNALGPRKINALSAQLAGLNPTTCAVTPASTTFENLFPSNTTGTIQPGLTTLGPLNNGFIKGDYVISPHHHISGLYYVSKSYQTVTYATGGIQGQLPSPLGATQWEANVPSNVQLYDGSWTWTPGSNWVNDFRAGYDYIDSRTVSGDRNVFTQPAWPAGYGFNSGVTQAATPLYGGLPQIVIQSFTGYLGAGRRTGVRGPDGDASFVDNVSWLHGKHAFKFGFQFMDLVYDNDSYNQANGQVKFKDLQHFLQGAPRKGAILVGDPNVIVRAHWFSGYFQDDFRATTRLTLNLGLRWEYQGNPVEHNNYEGTFLPNAPATTYPVVQVGPGTTTRNMYNPYHKAFSPRLGLAWDMRGNGKTVVRAGASILREPELVGEYVGISPFGANVPDLNINTSGQAVNIHTPVTLALRSSDFNWSVAGPVFPVGTPTVVNGVPYTGTTCLSPNDVVSSGPIPPPCETQGVNPNFVQPHIVAWNLDIQRAITNNLTIDVAYVGNHGVHQTDWIDINEPTLGAGFNTPFTGPGASAAGLPATAVGLTSNQICLASAPAYNACGIANPEAEVGSTVVCTACPYGTKFPYLTYIDQLNNGDYSHYNALQLTVNERVSHGLSFLTAYTYSHALDIVSGENSSAQPFPISAYAERLNYASSDNDVRHRFTFSPTYALPGMKSPGQMLQGWTISSIITLQSGLPWYPTDETTDLTGTNGFNDTISSSLQTWNYSGPASAFQAGPTSIPCFTAVDGKGNPIIPGCTAYVAGQPPAACMSAAQANGALAVASLMNLGCYVQGGGVLTPPAYGSVGSASRNMFRVKPYHNIDFSITKDWKFTERFGAQFRAEFFNLFNWANFALPAAQSSGVDPSTGSQFGCACATPDVQNNNPVLGSGGPRHIQFGLKLLF
jgi:carboxypeptidase family protein